MNPSDEQRELELANARWDDDGGYRPHSANGDELDEDSADNN